MKCNYERHQIRIRNVRNTNWIGTNTKCEKEMFLMQTTKVTKYEHENYQTHNTNKTPNTNKKCTKYGLKWHKIQTMKKERFQMHTTKGTKYEHENDQIHNTNKAPNTIKKCTKYELKYHKMQTMKKETLPIVPNTNMKIMKHTIRPRKVPNTKYETNQEPLSLSPTASPTPN